MIKIDMEMPCNCDQCRFLLQINNANCYASESLMEINDIKVKPVWCPLIECENENIVKCIWSSRNTNSLYRYNAGNCFKTKEEITPEIKQLILQEMKGKYEND